MIAADPRRLVGAVIPFVSADDVEPGSTRIRVTNFNDAPTDGQIRTVSPALL